VNVANRQKKYPKNADAKGKDTCWHRKLTVCLAEGEVGKGEVDVGRPSHITISNPELRLAEVTRKPCGPAPLRDMQTERNRGVRCLRFLGGTTDPFFNLYSPSFAAQLTAILPEAYTKAPRS